MLIIGIIVVTTPCDQGMFFCPVCRESRPYRRQLVRKYIAFFSYPILPLDRAADQILCNLCGRRFSAEVLRVDVGSRERDFASHLRQLLLLMVAGQGPLTPESQERVRSIYRRFTGENWGESEMRHTLETLDPDTPSPARYLERVALHLGERDKDRLVQAGFLMAAGAQGLSDAGRLELEQFPQALHISETRFRKLVEQALAHE